MDDERWEALVRRLEPQARARPAAYRRKVVLLALLGYAFIATLLLLLLGLGVLVVVLAFSSSGLLLKFLIPIGALFFVILRALYVKVTPPEGVRLSRKQAPKLFSMIDEVRKRIRGPRVHDVRVDGDTNASVVQVPRALGIFGSRNYLVLGLPYLNALSPDQMRAVVAHELGHLSRAHGRFGVFVYRVRATWFSLLHGLEMRKSMWTGLVHRFFLWYVPYFNAYTLPLARAHEFEADDAAVDAAGKEATGASLVKGMLAARWAQESYWPGVFRRVLDEPAPPQTALAPMAEGNREGEPRGERRNVVSTAGRDGDERVRLPPVDRRTTGAPWARPSGGAAAREGGWRADGVIGVPRRSRARDRRGCRSSLA